jgi:hypothetical protein
MTVTVRARSAVTSRHAMALEFVAGPGTGSHGPGGRRDPRQRTTGPIMMAASGPLARNTALGPADLISRPSSLWGQRDSVRDSDAHGCSFLYVKSGPVRVHIRLSDQLRFNLILLGDFHDTKSLKSLDGSIFVMFRRCGEGFHSLVFIYRYLYTIFHSFIY